MSINFIMNTVPQGIELATTIGTGGTVPLAMRAGQQALALTTTNSFNNSLTQLGITGNTRDVAVRIFGGSFADASGFPTGDSPAAQAVLDASFRNGNLAPASQDVTDSMTRMTIALGIKGQEDAGSGGGGDGESWLEAIARAMGKALGNMAQNHSRMPSSPLARACKPWGARRKMRHGRPVRMHRSHPVAAR